MPYNKKSLENLKTWEKGQHGGGVRRKGKSLTTILQKLIDNAALFEKTSDVINNFAPKVMRI